MALKSSQSEGDRIDIEDALDYVDKALDRVKVLYEQYFLGMQKQPPSQIHTDVERRLRELQQLSIRNTGLRYRFATLQQKFGSYNSYWRRTLRQIENGTYLRNLSKISRQAAVTGEAIPSEILAAMPQRMREQVKRDREQALAIQRRRDHEADGGDQKLDTDDAAFIGESPAVRSALPRSGPIKLDNEDDFDIDAFFASVTDEPIKPTFVPSVATLPPGARSEHTQMMPVTPPHTTHDGPGTQVIPVPPPPSQPSQQGLPVQRATPLPSTLRPQRVEPQPTQAMPVVPPPRAPGIPPRPTPIPKLPPLRPPTGAPPSGTPAAAPSQASRPNPIAPGSSTGRQAIPVQSIGGRAPAKPEPKPEPAPPGRPSGMNDADVNALYAKYVKAKEAVGEPVGPGAYGKLLKTISVQAPKIMEQYKAKGVEFSVVVKDNQVIIKAKPKT